jgi:hypothetical protein
MSGRAVPSAVPRMGANDIVTTPDGAARDRATWSAPPRRGGHRLPDAVFQADLAAFAGQH